MPIYSDKQSYSFIPTEKVINEIFESFVAQGNPFGWKDTIEFRASNVFATYYTLFQVLSGYTAIASKIPDKIRLELASIESSLTQSPAVTEDGLYATLANVPEIELVASDNTPSSGRTIAIKYVDDANIDVVVKNNIANRIFNATSAGVANYVDPIATNVENVDVTSSNGQIRTISWLIAQVEALQVRVQFSYNTTQLKRPTTNEITEAMVKVFKEYNGARISKPILWNTLTGLLQQELEYAITDVTLAYLDGGGTYQTDDLYPVFGTLYTLEGSNVVVEPNAP